MNWIGREPTVFTGVLECYLWLEGVDEGYLCKNHDSQIDSQNPSHLTNRLLIPYLILYFRPNRCGSFCSLLSTLSDFREPMKKSSFPLKGNSCLIFPLPLFHCILAPLHSHPTCTTPGKWTYSPPTPRDFLYLLS